jgi:hypothetical protein
LKPSFLNSLSRRPPRAIQALHLADSRLEGISLVDLNEASLSLAEKLLHDAAVPAGSEQDALHIVICTPEELLRSNVMWTDEIVDDVRKVRQALAAAHAHDLKSIFRELKRKQDESERRIVT